MVTVNYVMKNYVLLFYDNVTVMKYYVLLFYDNFTVMKYVVASCFLWNMMHFVVGVYE